MTDEQLRGEYWIDADGDVQTVCEDTGDNHQALVAAEALSRVCDRLQLSNDPRLRRLAEQLEQQAFAGDVTAVRCYLHDVADAWQKHGDISVEEAGDPWRWVTTHGPVPAQLLAVATTDVDDSREYAMHHWGWTAVRQDRLETHGLTDRKLRRIATGLSRILEDEGLYAADPDFVFADWATGNVYHVTLADLEQGSATALFGRRSSLINL